MIIGIASWRNYYVVFPSGFYEWKTFKVSLHMETIHLESSMLFWRADEDFKGVLVTVKYTQLWKVWMSEELFWY